MRLFTAIAFDESLKEKILSESEKIRPFCSRASFTAKPNLHLTLKFLGETDSALLPAINKALESAAREHHSFEVPVSHFGSFKGGPDGQTLWLGLKNSKELAALFSDVDKRLAEVGFSSESRPFKAHITIARRAVCDSTAISKLTVSEIMIPVSAVTLYESLREQGVLVYRPLAVVRLQNNN